VQLEFSRPGKLTDNAQIESFNGSLRDECLNVHWFKSLADAQEKLDSLWIDYRESRSHSALNHRMSAEYAAELVREGLKFSGGVARHRGDLHMFEFSYSGMLGSRGTVTCTVLVDPPLIKKDPTRNLLQMHLTYFAPPWRERI